MIARLRESSDQPESLSFGKMIIFDPTRQDAIVLPLGNSLAQEAVETETKSRNTVYGISAALELLVGRCADRSKSRRSLLGLVAFWGATVMVCLARIVALLVVGQTLQGCSGAIIWTVGETLLVNTVGQKDIDQTRVIWA